MPDDQHQEHPTSSGQITTSSSQQTMNPPHEDTCSSRSEAGPDPDHATKVPAGWPSAIPPHPNHQSASSLGNKRTCTPPSCSSQPPAHKRAKRYDPCDSALGLFEGYAHDGAGAEERPLLPDLSELCFEAEDPETLYVEPKRVL